MPLGYFQFDNLLRNRVHFFIFSWVDLTPLQYGAMEKRHLEAIATNVEGLQEIQSLQTLIKDKGLESNAPLLLIDEDGENSRRYAQALAEDGFINVFWALGGLRELVKERALDTLG